MMKALVLYDLNDKTHAEQSRIIRVLFGFKDKSNNGKYWYDRPGLLSKIPFERRTKTVLIVQKRHVRKVVEGLKKQKVRAIVVKLPQNR